MSPLRSLTITFAVAFLAVTTATGAAVRGVTHATIADLADARLAVASGVVIGGGQDDADTIRRRMRRLVEDRANGHLDR